MRRYKHLFLALSAFGAYAVIASFASSWTGPTATPPGNNVASILTTGTASQVKNGNLSVNGFSAWGNAQICGANCLQGATLFFSSTTDSTGYGIRDNAGTLQFKNVNGSWSAFGSGSSQWTTSGSNIYYNTGNVGIGTTTPDANLALASPSSNSIISLYNGSSGAEGWVNRFTDRLLISSTNNVALGAGGQTNNQLWLSSTGNVGIGNTNPGYKLDVYGDTRVTGVLSAYSGTGGEALLSSAGGFASNTGYLAWYKPGNTTRLGYMGWDPNNVWLNLENNAQFIINGNTTQILGGGAWPTLRLENSGNWSSISMRGNNGISSLIMHYGGDSSNELRFGRWSYDYNTWQANPVRFNMNAPDSSVVLNSDGTVNFGNSVTATAYYYSSDARLKDNIQPFGDALTTIEHLRGVTFDWKKDGTPSAGVIAQEIEKVLPSAVHTDPKTGMKSVEYVQIIAPLIEAVKEQQTEIDAQNQRITTLEHDIAQLKAGQ